MENRRAIAEIAFRAISVEIVVEIGEICGNGVENGARLRMLRTLCPVCCAIPVLVPVGTAPILRQTWHLLASHHYFLLTPALFGSISSGCAIDLNST
jgi:hypothetical protein